MSKSNIKKGGKREGAGRKKTKEDTVVIRVPLSMVDQVKKMISTNGLGEQPLI